MTKERRLELNIQSFETCTFSNAQDFYHDISELNFEEIFILGGGVSSDANMNIMDYEEATDTVFFLDESAENILRLSGDIEVEYYLLSDPEADTYLSAEYYVRIGEEELILSCYSEN